MAGPVVDIHNHILPGMDDGAQTWQDALALAENAVENGITHIISTPHQKWKGRTQSLDQLKEQIALLNEYLMDRKIPVQILIGMEVPFSNELPEELGVNLIPLAEGNYLLLELPSTAFPAYTFEILYKIQLAGYRPIIAHPERNIVLRKQIKTAVELVRRGALFQVTASSVIGKDGFTLKKTTHQFIRHNLVHLIASDAHHSIHRPILLKDAYDLIGQKYSEQYKKYLMENAIHVMNGSEVFDYG